MDGNDLEEPADTHAVTLHDQLLSIPIRKFVDGQASDSTIPSRVKALAAVSLLVWISVITTGRLIAYVG